MRHNQILILQTIFFREKKSILYMAILPNLTGKEVPMPYKPIEIGRKNLTIMGFNFSSVSNFDSVVIPSERPYLKVINIGVQSEVTNG